MTTEQMFNKLWDLGYTLEDSSNIEQFNKAVSILANLFPEEEWGN
jgi:hypothetical protein